MLGAPAYWYAHGVPARPCDIEGHDCFAFRNPSASSDVWIRSRHGGANRCAAGCLATATATFSSRGPAGEGLIRAPISSRNPCAVRPLRAVLTDWMASCAAGHVLFRPHHRRTPRCASSWTTGRTFRPLEANRAEHAVAPPGERAILDTPSRASIGVPSLPDRGLPMIPSLSAYLASATLTPR